MSEKIVRREASSFVDQQAMLDYLNGRSKYEKRISWIGLGAAALLAFASAVSGNSANRDFLIGVISEPAIAVSNTTGIPLIAPVTQTPQPTSTITPTVTASSNPPYWRNK